MIILGLSGALDHDASAALYIDGKLVAAVEEERFTRDKHAMGSMPYESAKFCLQQAEINPSSIDVVAVPFAPVSFLSSGRWHFATRNWTNPYKAFGAIFDGNHNYYRYVHRIQKVCNDIGVDFKKTRFESVEHHLAHASSAYHLSGFKDKTAILSIDGKGEYVTTFFGYGERGKIYKIKEFHDPDSLSGLYGSFTEYLGFKLLDGEHKVMGMSSYGDPTKYDFSKLVDFDDNKFSFSVNNRLVNTTGVRCYKTHDPQFYVKKALIDWLGHPKTCESVCEPFSNYAASIQMIFEKVTLKLIEHYLGDVLKETGRLVLSGGGAQNIKLNQKIMELPYVKQLWVQPASGDSGTAVGAASFVSERLGVPVEKMTNVFLGPSYSNQECISACMEHPEQPIYEVIEQVPQRIATILAEGHPVAWFQGRMEFGPRALGGRSILGCPSVTGIANRINKQIKFREPWRPFSPSILDTVAKQVLQSDHPSPFMNFAFDIEDSWKKRIPEVIHIDGTARVQIVSHSENPRYYALLQELEKITGNAAVLNTSLNRRGEPIVCTPMQALDMFFNCDLQYLIMENVLVVKTVTNKRVD